MDHATGTEEMAGEVIRGKFPHPVKFGEITISQLAELTGRVTEETGVQDVIASYTTYCHEHDLRPSRKAHFDWAHEMLGTVFVQDARIKR